MVADRAVDGCKLPAFEVHDSLVIWDYIKTPTTSWEAVLTSPVGY